MSEQDPRQNLIDILKKTETVMVVNTPRDGVPHARPMAVADVSSDGTLWFVTSRVSEKAREVRADDRALITGAEGSRYVSVSGHMELVDDRARIHALWREPWKVWFPKGKDDPEIVLMKLVPEAGEYWDMSGLAGVRYIFEAAKAYLNGTKPQAETADQHAKVQLQSQR